MKNKYFSFVALAAAALATSCASDDLAEQKQEQTDTRTVTLTASVNEGQTRVGMTKGENSTASFYWHKNDQIFVQTKNGDSYTGTAFSITGDDAKDGDTKATFTGEVTGTVGTYAVYPYNESHSFTGETALTYNLPASYTSYTPESNIFSKTTDGTTAYPSNPTNMPMLGKIADGKISFKCLGGLAVIRVDKMPITSGTLTVSANEKLSGNFEVDLSATDAQIATTTASDGNNTVTFTFSGATEGKAGVFYLPLATGSYTNFQVTLSDNSDYNQDVSIGSLTISRAGVTAVPIMAYVKVNDHWFVDLGLPSGLLWATMNIGATSVTDCGSYFAWGGTTALSSSSDTDGSYTEEPATLPTDHDAAYVNWGTSCRMPTTSEFNELLNSSNCSWNWTTVNNVQGYKVTSKKEGYTGNSIFFPAMGWTQGPGYINWNGYFWSSTCHTGSSSNYAYVLAFTYNVYMSRNFCGDYDREKGLPVRPVATKTTTTE